MIKTLIVGVGNLLLKDEGVGIHVAQRMMKMALPEGLEVVDAGTSLLDVFPVADGVGRMIIVDAMKAGRKPGTIYKLSSDDIERERQEILSLHQIDLPQMLDMCALMGARPFTIIIGIEPKDMEPGLDLSPEIESRIPEVIDIILKEIRGDRN